jgi:hypothetical protein
MVPGFLRFEMRDRNRWFSGFMPDSIPEKNGRIFPGP